MNYPAASRRGIRSQKPGVRIQKKTHRPVLTESFQEKKLPYLKDDRDIRSKPQGIYPKTE